ncbi:MAG: dihydrolipoyl dehydrogenase [Candidatus Omnitrophica bacterium]|nr:dihydrolipoyl dehydrogenase [Candidatus Omnitrophota bacterium]
MNKQTRYHLIVIGSGPGGYVAAIRASQLGMKAAIVEKDRPGGVCLNWGCIPTKALLKSAEVYESMQKAGAYGLKVDQASFDLAAIVERSRGISDRNAQGVDYLFKKNKIDLIKGEASLQSKNSVQVKSQKETAILEADHIIIATGARPRELPGIQIDRERIITSKEAMTLTTLPKRLAIVGSGAIGMEFAYYYRVFGAEVTILEALDRVLPVEDAEISKLAARLFSRRGIKIETGALASAVVRNGEGVYLDYEAGGQKKSLEADVALIAVGVAPNIENLGLDKAGVKTNKAGVSVNEHMQTDAPSIYAIGDVIGPPWLAHAASEEGVHAVEHIAGKNPPVIDYSKMPGCTYCKPQVASVGYTEEKAKKEGIEYTVGKFSFKASGRALAAGDTDGIVKLLFEKKYGGLIGGHIIGGEATEMIHEIALGMNQEVTAEEIARTIHAHPTLGESIREAALDALGERIHGA